MMLLEICEYSKGDIILRRSNMVVVISLFLFFLFLGFAVLFVMGRTTGYLKQLKIQKTKIRAEEGLDDAQKQLQKRLEEEFRLYAQEEYEEQAR